MARYETGYDQAEAERRKRSKEVYETLVRAVDFNSGRMQPPLASKPSVVGTLCRGDYSLEEIHTAIRAARSNGDLFQTTDDAEGRTRLGIDDADTLAEKTGTYFSRIEASRRRADVIGLANKRVQYLRGERDVE